MVENVLPIRSTLSGSKSNVRIADKISSSFVFLTELEQADALSNFAVNVTLEEAVQRSGTMVTQSHILLGFSDGPPYGIGSMEQFWPIRNRIRT